MELWIIAVILISFGLFLYICSILYKNEQRKNKEKMDEMALEITYLKKHNEYVEAEKYKNWGDNRVTTGPYSMSLREPAKLCVFSQWDINDDCPGNTHHGFCRVYGKANAEKVLKALNGS